jgi:hypothetical protein
MSMMGANAKLRDTARGDNEMTNERCRTDNLCL